jgi:hypothetical protein
MIFAALSPRKNALMKTKVMDQDLMPAAKDAETQGDSVRHFGL